MELVVTAMVTQSISSAMHLGIHTDNNDSGGRPPTNAVTRAACAVNYDEDDEMVHAELLPMQPRAA